MPKADVYALIAAFGLTLMTGCVLEQEQDTVTPALTNDNGVNWNGVNWNGVNWNGVNWNGVNWNGVNWNGVNWNGVNWNGVNWNGVNFLASEKGGFSFADLDFHNGSRDSIDWNGVRWEGAHPETVEFGDKVWADTDYSEIDFSLVDWNLETTIGYRASSFSLAVYAPFEHDGQATGVWLPQFSLAESLLADDGPLRYLVWRLWQYAAMPGMPLLIPDPSGKTDHPVVVFGVAGLAPSLTSPMSGWDPVQTRYVTAALVSLSNTQPLQVSQRMVGVPGLATDQAEREEFSDRESIGFGQLFGPVNDRLGKPFLAYVRAHKFDGTRDGYREHAERRFATTCLPLDAGGIGIGGAWFFDCGAVFYVVGVNRNPGLVTCKSESMADESYLALAGCAAKLPMGDGYAFEAGDAVSTIFTRVEDSTPGQPGGTL